jgi:hypothetical protein
MPPALSFFAPVGGLSGRRYGNHLSAAVDLVNAGSAASARLPGVIPRRWVARNCAPSHATVRCARLTDSALAVPLVGEPRRPKIGLVFNPGWGQSGHTVRPDCCTYTNRR